MKKCFMKGCDNQGTEYRDFTITGIGDIRLYCKVHVGDADRKEAVLSAERTLRYELSLAKKAVSDYEKATDRVVKAQDELLAAKMALITSA